MLGRPGRLESALRGEALVPPLLVVLAGLCRSQRANCIALCGCNTFFGLCGRREEDDWARCGLLPRVLALLSTGSKRFGGGGGPRDGGGGWGAVGSMTMSWWRGLLYHCKHQKSSSVGQVVEKSE